MANKGNSHQPRLFDYLIEAIAPALIIGMICCLVFFLIVVFYRGEFDLRLMYILGLFTFATVLIARIAIESGRNYSIGFAVPLAIATLLATTRFVSVSGSLAQLSWLFNVGLLGLIWYLADRITYDCTLDDRKRKIRQEGLLQTLGLITRPTEWSHVSDELKDDAATQNQSADTKPSRSKAKHNPGVWVLRFALLALPLFGLGQLVISDSHGRNLAFWFLFGYLGFALSLLVCTSLLSVRQYLHNRGAKMPAEIASIWLASGAIGVFLILLLCILLPLPGRNLGLIELPFEVGSPNGLLSSRFGWGGEGTSDDQNSEAAKSKSDEGDPSGEAEPDGKGPAEASDKAAKNAPQKNADSGKKSNSSQSNDTSSGEPSKNQSTRSDEPTKKAARKNEPSKSKSQASPPSTNFNRFLNSFNADFATLFKWLTILVLVLFVLVYAITHPREVAKFWREIVAFLAALFGRRQTRAEGDPQKGVAQNHEPKHTCVPFSSYVNPFQSGEQLSGILIVERTFAALESWAAEAGVARSQEETSREFVGRLVASVPQLGKTPIQAANMLDQVMFAEWKPTTGELQPLEQLWRSLTSRQIA